MRKMWGSDIPQSLDLGHAPALVVVDMTAAFVEDQYPTGWAETGEPCAAAVQELVASARAFGMPVFYTVTEPLVSASAVATAYLRTLGRSRSTP